MSRYKPATTRIDPLSMPALTAVLTGGCSAALGLSVLFGWMTENATYVQVLPSLVPMQVNTAINFVLCGIGLIAIAFEWRRTAAACGIVAATIGLITLGEYLFGVNLGLDQLVMRSYILTKTSHPGRMAPNTALCFLLTGAGLLAMCWPPHQSLMWLLPGLAGAMVFAFGLVAALGYMTGLYTAYSWEPFTDMAVHTAAGFIALGAGLMPYAWRQYSSRSTETVSFLPMMAGLILTTITLCLWQALMAYEHVLIHKTVTLVTANVRTEIIEQVTSRVQELERMARRWEVQGQPPPSVWETDVALHLKHDPYLLAMVWIDSTRRLRWSQPLQRHTDMQGDAITSALPVRQLLEAAQESRETVLTHALNWVQSGDLQIVVPLFPEDGFEGFLIGLFHIKPFLSHIIDNFASDFAITISNAGETIYTYQADQKRFQSTWNRTITADLPGLMWQLNLWPTPALLEGKLSVVPTIILLMGLATATLLASLVHFVQVARRRAIQLTETNAALSQGIDERDRVESALSKRLHQLEVLGAICTDVTRELDLKLLLDLILHRSTELIPAAESGAIFLWSDSEHYLLPEAWLNRGDWIQDVKLSLGEGLAGVVAQRREGLRVDDYQASPYAHAAFRDHVGTTAFLVEPLVYQNQLVGVISLSAKTLGKTFTEEDAYLLKIFAAQAVTAIENARHHTQQMQQLTLLMQSNAAVQGEIIERQQAEEQLHETYQFLQSTLDAMPAHVAILDETGIILGVNAAWHRFAEHNGFSDDSHGVGTSYLTICASVPEDDEESSVAREIGVGIREVMSGHRDVFSHEYACHCPTEQRWFLLHATRFESRDRLRVVVVHENITEVKQVQIELQRQQEMLYQNEKLAAMSGLLASVAHELNNPLSVITMQADLLQEEASEGELASLGAEINQAAERCVRIVRNFLALARHTSPERTQVNLNEVIREALQLLTPLLQVDDIEVMPYLADDLPPLWADSHQLHQVVVNLITNAQQALQDTQPPRRITLTTEVEPSTQQVRLEIEDNGPGIPPDVKERIFEPFFTTKEIGTGTGLGLPLCQGIIASHEGEFSVTSQPGRGAVFCVTIPIREIAECTEEPTPPELSSVAAGRKLLIVDDEAGTTKALVRLFGRDGYTVETARNGREALEKLRAQSYDVILCDLRMPELDGPGLYRELERDGSAYLPRFIFLTGDTLRPEAREFIEATEAPYLAKPFRAAEVRHIVRQALHSLE